MLSGTLRVGASELRPVEEEPRDRREGVRRLGAVGRADGRGAVVGVDAGPPTDRSRRTSSRDGRADTDARVAEGRGWRERGRRRCSSTSGPPGACRRPPCCPVNERSESAVTADVVHSSLHHAVNEALTFSFGYPAREMTSCPRDPLRSFSGMVSLGRPVCSRGVPRTAVRRSARRIGGGWHPGKARHHPRHPTVRARALAVGRRRRVRLGTARGSAIRGAGDRTAGHAAALRKASP